MRREVVGFGVYVTQDDDDYFPDQAVRSKMEAWGKASKSFEDEIPKAKSALEAKLCSIIGAA